jgi:hypothetical protein
MAALLLTWSFPCIGKNLRVPGMTKCSSSMTVTRSPPNQDRSLDRAVLSAASSAPAKSLGSTPIRAIEKTDAKMNNASLSFAGYSVPAFLGRPCFLP